MKFVLTMTLNPCIDRTVYLSRFQIGATNYVDKTVEDVAGKGINVAVGLSHIGVLVKAMGFAFSQNKKELYDKLEGEGIPHAFVEVPGKMRINQKLFDRSLQEMTECNERGREVEKEDVDKLLVLLEKELENAEILVLCGSVPPGVPGDIYARMIRMAKKAGVLVVLDASRELLAEGVKEVPYLIKPNLEEFCHTFLEGESKKDFSKKDFSKKDFSKKDFFKKNFSKIEEKAKELVESGITHVCISLGKEGLLWAHSGGTEKFPAKEAEVKSLQGAGDAMVAGFCKAIYEKQEKNMAEYALRMAASTIGMEGTGMGFL